MKKFLIAGVAVAAFYGAPALAADMAVKAPPPPPAPVYSWSGWYIGGNAGWVGSEGDITNTGTDTAGSGLGTALADGIIPASLSLRNSEFLGGAQIGYNWQVANLVYGLEGDVDGAGSRRTVAFGNHTGLLNPTDMSYFGNGLDWLGTFRGRIGVTWSPSFLLYATGGLAFGQTTFGTSISCTTCTTNPASEPTTTNQSAKTSVGWTAGGGVEWMFTPRWSLKAEYLYADLGHNSSTIIFTYGANISTMTSTAHETENIVRGGINYHF